MKIVWILLAVCLFAVLTYLIYKNLNSPRVTTITQQKSQTTVTQQSTESTEGEHFIIYGQSLSIGYNCKPIMSTQQTYPDNILTLNSSPRELGETLVPLVEKVDVGGKWGETPSASLARTYYTYIGKPKHLKVIVTAPGVSGRTVQQLTEEHYYRYEKASLNVGSAFQGTKLSHPITFWIQGEADGAIKNTQEEYVSRFKTLASKMKETHQKNYGKGTHTIISYQTCAYSARGNIQKAQIQLHMEGVLMIATPIYFLKFSSDDLHLTTSSSQMLGAYFGRAASYVKNGKKPPLVFPLKAERNGENVTLSFEVPTPPLQLVKSNFFGLPLAFDYGFQVVGRRIAEVTVQNNTQILLRLVPLASTLPPGGQLTITYALGPRKVLNEACHGGLRDSCEEKVYTGTQEVVLYNYAPHFEIMTS